MISRKERNNKRTSKSSLLVKTCIVGVFMFSSTSLAFANQDLNGLLTNWFEKKGNESIQLIDEVISNERDNQTHRIKEELQKELRKSEEDLAKFTKHEIDTRVKELRKHADQIIKNLSIDNKEEKAQLISHLDKIVSQAVSEMNGINLPTQGPERKLEAPEEQEKISSDQIEPITEGTDEGKTEENQVAKEEHDE